MELYIAVVSYYEKFQDGTVNCVTNEIPFQIPENWRFERIRNVLWINPKNVIDDKLQVSFIPMAMIEEQFSGNYEFEVREWKTCKKGFTHFATGDVAFAKISPCFENRKSVYFENLKNNNGSGTTELYVLRRYTEDILGKYLLYFVKSEYFILRGKSTFSGVVGQQRIDKEYIMDSFIPIPPVCIQRQIIYKVQSIMNYLSEIEASLS